MRHAPAPWVWALVLLAHALLLGAVLPHALDPTAPASPPLASRAVVRLRTLPAIVPASVSAAAPPVVSTPTPEAALPSPARPAAQAQRMPPSPAAAEALRPTSVSEAPTPQAAPATAPVHWARNGQWRYRLTHHGESGEALLSWQVEDGRYALRLERRVGERALPVWRSEGHVAPEGMVPEQFAAAREGRAGRRVAFDAAQGLVRQGGRGAAVQPLEAGTQDRLSWWMQLAARAEGAARQGRAWRVGQRLAMTVVPIRGAAQTWVFELVDADAQGRLHWRRGPQGPHDAWLEVWLDPAREHLPLRVRQQLGDEAQWELQLDEAAPASSEAASAAS